jgi:hypothetical protein
MSVTLLEELVHLKMRSELSVAGICSMQKRMVMPRRKCIHIQPTPGAVAVLSRKDRKLWAGAVTREDTTTRMRDDSPAGYYGTAWNDPALDELWDTEDAASEGLEVKPQEQTAE